MGTKTEIIHGVTTWIQRGLAFVNVCACVGFSRVLAHPQVLKGQQAA